MTTPVTSPSMSASAGFHLPPEQRYTCHQSGQCCPVFPHIPVDQESAEVMQRHDYGQLPGHGCSVGSFAEGVVDPATVGANQDAPYSLKRRPTDGNCVFYGEDKLCALHKAFGSAGKPKICRDFPYRFRETPGGVYVGLSFVCPSVRGNKGAAVADQGAELREHYPRAFTRQNLVQPVLLNPKLEISWDDYLALEQGMDDLILRRDIPLATRLAALQVLVTMVDIIEQQRIGAHQPMAAARQSPDGSVAETIEALRRLEWAPVWQAAGRRPGSPALRRMFVGMMLSFGSTLWTTRSPLLVGTAIFARYVRHVAGWGRVRMNPLKTAAPHEALQGVRFPREGSAVELLDRWFRHAIFRKDFLRAPDVTRGVNLMLLNAAMVRWYAGAVAHGAGRSSPADDDFSEAVKHTETYFGLNSRLYERLQELPILDSVVESFFRRKDYPFIIVSES